MIDHREREVHQCRSANSHIPQKALHQSALIRATTLAGNTAKKSQIGPVRIR